MSWSKDNEVRRLRGRPKGKFMDVVKEDPKVVDERRGC